MKNYDRLKPDFIFCNTYEGKMKKQDVHKAKRYSLGKLSCLCGIDPGYERIDARWYFVTCEKCLEMREEIGIRKRPARFKR